MSKVLVPVLIIIFGVLMLLRNLFGWNISFFRVLVGVVIVAIGISLLTGGARWFQSGFGRQGDSGAQYQGTAAQTDQEIVFSQRHYTATGSTKFSYIFSSGTIDLTTLPVGQYTIQVDAIFSGVTVYVRPGQEIKLRGSAAFGSFRTPGGDGVYFGNIGRGEGDATLEGTAVFGGIEVVERG